MRLWLSLLVGAGAVRLKPPPAVRSLLSMPYDELKGLAGEAGAKQVWKLLRKGKSPESAWLEGAEVDSVAATHGLMLLLLYKPWDSRSTTAKQAFAVAARRLCSQPLAPTRRSHSARASQLARRCAGSAPALTS